MPPTLWIDGDACPRAIKELLYRTTERRGLSLVMVANQLLQVPRSPRIRAHAVSRGADAADDYIAETAVAGDVVVTQDIPLAARLVPRGVFVLDPRGKEWTPSNIGEALAMRDAMDELRGAGLVTGGPAPWGDREKQAFANSLDRLLTRISRPT